MRHFSAYEKNQLALHHISLETAAQKGEMPVEYMTGHVPFNGLDLLVTQDVLIPRVETEELISQAVRHIQEIKATIPDDPRPIHLADVGTGSGAIGISVSLALRKLGIAHEATLSDVSPEAVAIAQKNWQRHIKEPTPILVSDLLASYPSTQQFDLFVANLPYIPTARIPSLESSVVDFEPHLALDGGPEGLSLMEQFLKQAKTKISPVGRIILEIDYTHAEDILRLNKSFQGLVVPDTFGQPRFAIFRLKP